MIEILFKVYIISFVVCLFPLAWAMIFSPNEGYPRLKEMEGSFDLYLLGLIPIVNTAVAIRIIVNNIVKVWR